MRVVAEGSILFADDARSYTKAAESHGLVLRTVDHNKGVYAVASTNGTDGNWGRLKTWLRAQGGVPDGLLLGYIKEFQWRANLGIDFIILAGG